MRRLSVCGKLTIVERRARLAKELGVGREKGGQARCRYVKALFRAVLGRRASPRFRLLGRGVVF